MAALGILGGSFNPPHCAHLACAEHALEALDLDLVALMPLGSPPHKAPGLDPGPEHRLAMCRLAVEGRDRMGVSELEINRGGTSYTVDTLRALNESTPEDQLTFIVGGDMARTLPSWREPEVILELATLAVAERGTADRQAITEALRELPGAQRTRFLDMEAMAVSSSRIRDLVAAGEPIDGLVAPEVADYIAAHGLYRVVMDADDTRAGA